MTWSAFLIAAAATVAPGWTAVDPATGAAVAPPCFFKYTAAQCGSTAPSNHYFYGSGFNLGLLGSAWENQKWVLFTKDDNPNLGATDIDPASGVDITSAEIKVFSALYLKNNPTTVAGGRKSLLLEGDINGEVIGELSIQGATDVTEHTWSQFGLQPQGFVSPTGSVNPLTNVASLCTTNAAGTITVAAGGLTVTGASTSFALSTALPGSITASQPKIGDFLFTSAGVLIGKVANVMSASSLTLTAPAAVAFSGPFKFAATDCTQVSDAEINSLTSTASGFLSSFVESALAPTECSVKIIPSQEVPYDSGRKEYSLLGTNLTFGLVSPSSVIDATLQADITANVGAAFAADINTNYYVWKISDGVDEQFFIESKFQTCDWIGLASSQPCSLAGCTTNKCIPPRTPIMFGDFFVDAVEINETPYTITAPPACDGAIDELYGSDGVDCALDATGTITFTGGSPVVTGVNTNFVILPDNYYGPAAPKAGDFLYAGATTGSLIKIGQVASVTSATSLTLQTAPFLSSSSYTGAFSFAQANCQKSPAQCSKGWAPNILWNYDLTATGACDHTVFPNPNKSGQATIDTQCSAPVCNGGSTDYKPDVCSGCPSFTPGSSNCGFKCKTSFDQFEMDNKKWEKDQQLWNNHGEPELRIIPADRLWGTSWCGYGNEFTAFNKWLYRPSSAHPPGQTVDKNRCHKYPKLYQKNGCAAEEVRDDSGFAFSNSEVSGYKGMAVSFSHKYPRNPIESKKIKSVKWWIFRPRKCVYQNGSDFCFDQALTYVPGSVKAFSFDGTVASQGLSGTGHKCTPQSSGHPSSWSCTSISDDNNADPQAGTRGGWKGIELPATGATQQRLTRCRSVIGWLDTTFRSDFAWANPAHNRNIDGVWDRGLHAFTGTNNGVDTKSDHPVLQDYPQGLNPTALFFSTYYSVLLMPIIKAIVFGVFSVIPGANVVMLGILNSMWPSGTDPVLMLPQAPTFWPPTPVDLSMTEGNTRIPQLFFNNNAANGLFGKGIEERNCRQHDFCPLGQGESMLTCACDAALVHKCIGRQGDGQDWAHKCTGVFGTGSPWRNTGWWGVLHPCFNLKLKCEKKKRGKCIDWRLTWRKQFMNKFLPSKKEGKRLWGPIGRWDETPAACAPLRGQGEGNNKCHNPRIGNGICDDDLNTDHWGHDGGDCCASTCVDYIAEGSFPGTDYPGVNSRRLSCPATKAFCCRQQGCPAVGTNSGNADACGNNGVGLLTSTAGSTTVLGSNINTNNTNFAVQTKTGSTLFTLSTNAYIGRIGSTVSGTQATLSAGAALTQSKQQYREVDPFPSGTITSSTTSISVSGTAITNVVVGDFLFTPANAYIGEVAAVVSASSLTLTGVARTAVTGSVFRVLKPYQIKRPVGTNPLDTRSVSATISNTGVGTTVIYGEGTSFLNDFKVGDHLFSRSLNNADINYVGRVSCVNSQTTITLAAGSLLGLNSAHFMKADGLQGTVTTSGTTVTGSATAFTTQVTVGSHVFGVNGYIGRVASIASATSLTLAASAVTAVTGGLFYTLELHKVVPSADYNFEYSAWSACNTQNVATRTVTGCKANGQYPTVGCEDVITAALTKSCSTTVPTCGSITIAPMK